MSRLFIMTLLAFSFQAQAGTEIYLRSKTIKTDQLSSILSYSDNTEWIVQFKKHITANDKKSLVRAGFKIYSYIPEDALILRGPATAALILKQNPHVQTVIEFQPLMKVSSSFGTLSTLTEAAKETFVVSIFEAQENQNISQKISSISKEILVQKTTGTSLVVTSARSFLKAIAAIAGVEHIQPFVQIEPLHEILTAEDGDDSHASTAGDYSDITGFETGTKVMNFEAAWTKGYAGQNQVVGMADTGLDSGDANAIHTDFTGAIVSGYAVGMFGKTWADPMGHGTHVAGSVLGRGIASGGKLKGGAHAAKIVAQGMWSPILNNLSVPTDLGKMFSQAYADGARIHTNSWGGAATPGEYEKMASTVDQVMFEKQDLLIIFAAGNSGVDKNRDGRIDANSLGIPATAKNALTVGASENLISVGGNQKKIGELKSSKDNWPVPPITDSTMSDNSHGIAMFSSRGPTSDGRIKPDIMAPGTNILSARSHQPTAEVLWGEYNKDYVWSGGTSMATPLTAGAAAVTRQFLIEKLHQEKPTAALLKAYLLHTATEMFPGQYGEVGASQGQEILTLRPNSDEGYGLVNLAQVVGLPTVAGSLVLVDSKSGVATGEISTTNFKVTKAGHLMVNLVWTDAPGSPNAGKALVNDLSLEVTLPDGKVLSVDDQTNNHAFIQTDVAAGEITIKVKGSNVPMGLNGKQPFALVASVQ